MPKSDAQKTSVNIGEFTTSKSVGFLVRKAHLSYTRAMELRLREHGVSISMWGFLRLLWEKDGLSLKECSQELSLSQPTTVSAMNNLERRGLIRRVSNADDRRVTNIFLTDKGRNLRREIIHYADETNAAAESGLSNEEVDTLKSLLLRFNASIELDIDSYYIKSEK